jgi:hypothetical protein
MNLKCSNILLMLVIFTLPLFSQKELSVDDFKFDGPLGSQGTKIKRIAKNHFQITPGHAPQHPDWANMVQFEITAHAKGNSLRLDVEFPHTEPHYPFNSYSYSWSYDGNLWHPIHWKKYQVTRKGSDVLKFPNFTEDKVFVGHQVPFSNNDLEQLLLKWKNNPFIKIHNIGQSLGGKNIYRIVVTDTFSEKNKWSHYFINQHPGEHYAHWRMIGMLNWLLEGPGIEYLKKSINHFVFFMSPDAPANGWYRVNAQGVDMNRSYRALGADKNEQAHEAFVCQKDFEQLMNSQNSITDLWGMHTWQGAVEPILIAGREIGNKVGPWTDLRQAIIRNDKDLLIEPLKIRRLADKNTQHWNNGPHAQFGITTVLCEGAGNIYTKQENMKSGAVLMKSISEYYK